MRQPSSHARAPAQQRITRLLQALLLLLTVSSCGLQDSPNAGLTPPIPVQPPLRKQVLQGYMPFGSIGWVNNELVAFHGSPAAPKAGRPTLYLWNFKDKPVKLLANSINSCISEGTIRTTEISEAGEFKSLKLSKPYFRPQARASSSAPILSVFDPASCSWIASPTSLRGHKWQALRKGDGFLDFTPDGHKDAPNINVKHLDAEEQVVQDTGIRMEIPMLPMAVHAAHDDSYLVFDLNLTLSEAKDWIQSNKRTIWRLDREQRGEAVTLPAGPWVGLRGGTISFLPSRPGVLITTKNFSRDLSAGGAGLYLLRPGAPAQRLERGLVEEAAVSPDGCRIAYGFRPRLDTGLPEGGPRLVVLDLCGVTKPAKR